MEAFVLQQGQKNIEPLLQQAFKWVVDTSGRQITYMREYEDSVGELKDKKLTISWVGAEADTAFNNGEDVDRGEVENLKKKEKQIMDEAKMVVSEFDKVDRMKGFTCCGRVPNVWRRYCIGRKARVYIQRIEKFRSDNHSRIIGTDIPPGEVTANSRLNSVKPMACELQSRADVMNEIMRILKDDSIQEVGVWGPEGAGKSMLMNQVWYRVNKWEHFQRALVEVPKMQDPQMQDASNIEEEIQKQLFKEFCPKLLEKVMGVRERADHLRTRLNSDTEKKAVIILDGLWRKIDLDKIGIPRKGKKVCNVIVTARDMDLLVNDMSLSRERILPVKPLTTEESTKLFLYIVKRSGQNIDEDKKRVAAEFVKNCGGLPRLIEHQASILRNQSTISAWHDTLREARSQNTNKMLKSVQETLLSCSSDENDRKQIKTLFSLCGLFGEPAIWIDDLIVHCRALGIFTQDTTGKETMTVKETKDRVKRLLHVLRARFLVDGSSKVKITDLLREVAVLIAFEKNFLVMRNGGSNTRSGIEKWTRKQLDKCTALSIDELDILTVHPELKYPELKMLHLGSKHHFLKIGDDKFFNRMEKLRGLHLEKIDFVPPSFPSTDKDLENLESLCLDDCRLYNVGSICNLKRLQILKILSSPIVELPKDVTNLTDLRLLDLRGCHKLQVIEHGVLGGLKRLEELYLDDRFDKWGVPHYQSGTSRRNASLDELNELTWLSTLYVYVPNSTVFPENLKLEKLERYMILLGDVEKHSKSVNKRALRLDLSDSTSILWEEGIKGILHKTKSLHLKGAMQMPKPSIHQLCSQGFPFLQDLHLENCDSVEYIVESSESVIAFPNLKTLTIVKLKNLQEICNGQLADESFGQLNTIIVEKCDELKNLFDLSAMERFLALKTVEVKDCKGIRAIVNDDIEQNEETREDFSAMERSLALKTIEVKDCKGIRAIVNDDIEETRKEIKWDKLHHLSLENLPAIEGFCIRDTTQPSSRSGTSKPTAFFEGKLISFPGLRYLKLIGLGNVTKIWHQNRLPPELSNLRSLEVEGFKEASQLEDILFYSPSTTPPKESFFQKLASVFSCRKGFMTFEMEKHPLEPNTLYPDKHPQGNLGQHLCLLKVCGCDELKSLLTTSMVQALPCLSKLTIEKCKMMEKVIQVENKDNGSKSIEFTKLTTLCLESLDNLTAFSEGNISISFPTLKRIQISNCVKLTALFTDSKHGGVIEEFSGSLFHAKMQVSPPFPSLDDLEVCNVKNLKRVWHCHDESSQDCSESVGCSSKSHASELWKTFLKIKKLHITDCGSLVNIFDVEGSLDAEPLDNDHYHDAQLNEVHLKDLTDVKHIWGRKDPRGIKIRHRYLQKATLCKCQKIKFLFPAPMTKDLLQLESIEVEFCDRIKHLIGEENSQSGEEPPFFFPNVKTLKLWKLEKLMAICCRPRCSEWPALEQLTISECNNFKIFVSEYTTSQPPNQALLDPQPLFLVNKNSFCRLSTLEVSQNRLMKEIWRVSSPKELFRNLKVLKLKSAGEEPVILRDNFLDRSPHLESLQLHHVTIKASKTRESEGLVTKRSLREVELSVIPGLTDLKEALNSLLGTSSYSFGWLTSLQVSHCPGLAYLFTHSTLQSLDCLTRLTIANCEGMKVVVASEGGKTEGKVILDRLKRLTLESLQGLTSFCEGNYELEFPSLKEVRVRECSKMRRFTHGETTSQNLTKVEFEGRNIDFDDERNLNKIIKAQCKPSLIHQLLISKTVLPKGVLPTFLHHFTIY